MLRHPLHHDTVLRYRDGLYLGKRFLFSIKFQSGENTRFVTLGPERKVCVMKLRKKKKKNER